MTYKLGPSLMCANLGNLERDIRQLDEADVDFYHIDIMDGQFVPNFTLGPDLVKAIRSYTSKPLDIHLMVKEPERHIDLFASCGVEYMSIHAEATTNLHSTLKKIKDYGIKAGVALNPATPVSALSHVLELIDYIVLMTVNPGFAGQQFIPAMYDKIKEVKSIINDHPIDIQVDGNIGAATIPTCKEQGATMYVLGTSAVFNSNHTLKENVAITRELFV
ncbi:ribulose-phosphate 3-epimerase [Oceanobacillus oncorhynchi subsp. oncorhynchi]|uniref:ribulose-phosphate 3-epimerase n=1 Tax=Oceanobacillus TaxID=182709 RepID=UPI0030DA2690